MLHFRNWSGPTEYMTESNAYPIKLESPGTRTLDGSVVDKDGLIEISDGPWKGHRWAAPSVSSLRDAMRQMVARPEEAREKGAR